MEFKIDTKEKFTVITPQTALLAANMADALGKCIASCSVLPPYNCIVNLQLVDSIDEAVLAMLTDYKEKMYSAEHSFVVCGAKKEIAALIAINELEEALNLVPTESEAWDIVQMDEIEREFLSGDE